ncbi:cell division protein FtsL [Gammaproteobacteria bacterium]|nr:cell division protein FtsL [Gammaproteobacteria bacterium]
MRKLFYLLATLLFLVIMTLLNSIFLGDYSYNKKSLLINENNLQIKKNNNLKKENDILEFEIDNAQKSNDHIENFAREKLNLTYPNEEFIIFKKEELEKDE